MGRMACDSRNLWRCRRRTPDPSWHVGRYAVLIVVQQLSLTKRYFNYAYGVVAALTLGPLFLQIVLG